MTTQASNTVLGTDLIGKTAYGTDQKKIGTVNDVIMKQDGSGIEGVVVGVGGFLGLGEHNGLLMYEIGPGFLGGPHFLHVQIRRVRIHGQCLIGERLCHPTSFGIHQGSQHAQVVQHVEFIHALGQIDRTVQLMDRLLPFTGPKQHARFTAHPADVLRWVIDARKHGAREALHGIRFVPSASFEKTCTEVHVVVHQVMRVALRHVQLTSLGVPVDGAVQFVHVPVQGPQFVVAIREVRSWGQFFQ
ncbi:MAG: PRC-barrel domain containing protein [Rhodospirillales bacterium]|nr:PRC-barrel domain containing protein [Rhodospirillales bacterium]